MADRFIIGAPTLCSDVIIAFRVTTITHNCVTSPVSLSFRLSHSYQDMRFYLGSCGVSRDEAMKVVVYCMAGIGYAAQVSD